MSEHTAIQGFYTELLGCARAQVDAAREEEWETFEQLAVRRQELLTQSENALAADSVDELDLLLILLRDVAEADAQARDYLEAKRVELREEIGRFRRLVTMAAAYRAEHPPEGGTLLDAFSN